MTQAVVLLTARGSHLEAEVAVRTSFLALIRLKAACVDPDLARKVIRADLREQQKMGRLIECGTVSLSSEADRATLNERMREIHEALRDEPAESFSEERIARAVDAGKLYDTAFRVTSSAAHVTPRSLVGYFATEGAGEVVGLPHGSSAVDVDNHLLTAMEFLLIAMSLMVQRLEIEVPEEWEELGQHFRDLVRDEGDEPAEPASQATNRSGGPS